MLKKYVKNLSIRKRLIIIAIVAILLPLVVLTYLQFSSLIELENKTKAVYKENLRQSLMHIENDIGNKIERTFRDMLFPLGNARFLSEDRDEALKKHFEDIKKSHPAIEQVFIFSHCACNDGSKSLAYIDNGEFVKIIHTHPPHSSTSPSDNRNFHHILDSFNKARTTKTHINENRYLLTTQHTCSQFIANSKPTKTTYVFYHLVDTDAQKQIGFAGVALTQKAVKKDLLDGIISKAVDDLNSKSSNPPIVVNINDESDKQSIVSTANNQEYLNQINLAPPFSGWQMKIGFKDTNINTLARYGFWKNLLITFSILLLLILGVFLTIRATNREVGLAQAKSSFVANVSHELKTPLSLIRLFAEMLENNYIENDQKKRKYYQIIGDESRRLTHLIDNILDFSKIESGNRKYNFKYGHLSEVIEDVVSKYNHQIDKAGFKLKTNIEADTPPIFIDRNAIAQAIINLLDNAIKYSNDKKEITIDLKTEDSFLAVEIADRGIGISKADSDKIFEKFYRVSDGLVHDVKGNGLGLSLVKHIIDAHKGKISVKSTLGKGSRFIIRFPLKTEKESEQNNTTMIQGGYEVVESIDS